MSTSESIREILESKHLIDRLAAIEHERWAHWQQHVHSQCERQADGSVLMPAKLAARWETQITTLYSHLSAQEQESDRDQVRRYLPTILEALTR